MVSNRLGMVTMYLSQLVYTSEIIPAAFRLDLPLETELEKMLAPARRRNQDLCFTGLLIYSGGHFLQVLEGESRSLERLYAKIAIDKRHRNVQRLATLAIEHRMFSKWSMGLLNLDDRRNIDPSIFQKFQAHVHPSVSAEEIAGPLYEMLSEFKTFLDSDTPVDGTVARRCFAR